jgi:hypothetical protein
MKRPVRVSGKASAEKARKCTSLSLPSGAGRAASRGQSMAKLIVSVTIMVRIMSRYLHTRWGAARVLDKGKRGSGETLFAAKAKATLNQGLGGSDKLNICVIKIINNLLNRYDDYTGKYKILLNFFNTVTSQVKD